MSISLSKPLIVISSSCGLHYRRVVELDFPLGTPTLDAEEETPNGRIHDRKFTGKQISSYDVLAEFRRVQVILSDVGNPERRNRSRGQLGRQEELTGRSKRNFMWRKTEIAKEKARLDLAKVEYREWQAQKEARVVFETRRQRHQNELASNVVLRWSWGHGRYSSFHPWNRAEKTYQAY